MIDLLEIGDRGSRPQEDNGITALDQLQPDQVTSFVISRGPRGPRSASRGTSDLRSFLRYLLQGKMGAGVTVSVTYGANRRR